MPRFHFNRPGRPDTKGVELEDLAEARLEALAWMQRGFNHPASPRHQWHLEVTDAEGHTMFAVLQQQESGPPPTEADWPPAEPRGLDAP